MKNFDDFTDIDLDIKNLLDKLPNDDNNSYLYLRGSYNIIPNSIDVNSMIFSHHGGITQVMALTTCLQDEKFKKIIYHALVMYFINNKGEEAKFLKTIKKDTKEYISFSPFSK